MKVGERMMGKIERVAYMLQIHNSPEQVNKFIKQLLSGDEADIYIHIDQKSYQSIKGKIIEGPHVMVLPESVDCEWGDISQIDTTLVLLHAVMASNKSYDYVCLRSGQDLLVKDGFHDYLSENSGNVFLNYRSMTNELGLVELSWPKITRRRYTSAHPVRIYRRMVQEFHRRGLNLSPNRNYWPKEYSFYKGSQWFTIPFEVAKYMVDFLEKNEWYYKFFENTLIPDESFFHTLIMNSPFKEDVVNDNLLFLKWGETLKDRNSPQFLTSEDIPVIENSGHYFARKFDENIDPVVVNYFTEKYSLKDVGKFHQNEEQLVAVD